WAVAVFWAFVLLVLLLRSWAVRGLHAATRLEPMMVAVTPFVVPGDPRSSELGQSLATLVAARLDGAGGLTAASPRSGSSLGTAGLQVRGQLFVAGGRLRALAILYDRGNDNAAIAHAQAEVEGHALFDLADALASQLIAGRYRGPHQRLTWAALSSTRSLPALKAYLLGEHQFQVDSYPAAIDAFSQAVAADTAFALAYYRLSLAADRAEEGATANWAAKLASRYGDRLSDHDLRLVQADMVRRQGRLDEAAQLYREIVNDYPEDTEAWLRLRETLQHVARLSLPR
ncbi:MAG TPA: tetratricopeptide repeat protein, partial [Gemmatimonadales bacterium]